MRMLEGDTESSLCSWVSWTVLSSPAPLLVTTFRTNSRNSSVPSMVTTKPREGRRRKGKCRIDTSQDIDAGMSTYACVCACVKQTPTQLYTNSLTRKHVHTHKHTHTYKHAISISSRKFHMGHICEVDFWSFVHERFACFLNSPKQLIPYFPFVHERFACFLNSPNNWYHTSPACVCIWRLERHPSETNPRICQFLDTVCDTLIQCCSRLTFPYILKVLNAADYYRHRNIDIPRRARGSHPYNNIHTLHERLKTRNS